MDGLTVHSGLLVRDHLRLLILLEGIPRPQLHKTVSK